VPVLFALLSSLLWGTGDFIGGTLARKRSAFLVVGWSQAAGLVFASCAVVVTGLDRPWTEVFPDALGAAVTGYAGLVLFYAALARGTMGVVAPITALSGIVPVAAGLIRGEEPTWLQIVGVVVALLGVVLASGPELSGEGGTTPIVMSVVAAVCFGFTLLFIADGAADDPLATVTLMRLVTTTVATVVVLVIVVGLRRPEVVSVPRSMILGLITAGAFDVAANLAFAHASTMGMLTIVAVVGSLYPVMTAVLARVIHHERLARIQQFGVGLAIAGIAVISAA
jgi:drug/metabolite transporter (DMT)-like permease